MAKLQSDLAYWTEQLKSNDDELNEFRIKMYEFAAPIPTEDVYLLRELLNRNAVYVRFLQRAVEENENESLVKKIFKKR